MGWVELVGWSCSEKDRGEGASSTSSARVRSTSTISRPHNAASTALGTPKRILVIVPLYLTSCIMADITAQTFAEVLSLDTEEHVALVLGHITARQITPIETLDEKWGTLVSRSPLILGRVLKVCSTGDGLDREAVPLTQAARGPSLFFPGESVLQRTRPEHKEGRGHGQSDPTRSHTRTLVAVGH